MPTGNDIQLLIEMQNKASKEIAKVRSDIKGLATEAKTSMKQTAGGFDMSTGSMAKFGVVAGLASAAFQKVGQYALMAGEAMISNASAMEQNRVSFEVMLGSGEKAGALLQQLSDFARKTPFNMPQVVEGAKSLLAYNVEAEMLIPTFNALGNIAAGVGKDKMPQLILAFGQVRAAGQLTGAELRQFTEAGVPMLEVLAKQSGKSAAEVKKDMEGGMAPSFGEVEKALFSMSEKGGKFFNLLEKQSKTLSGSWSNLQDDMIRIGNSIMGIQEDGTVAAGSLFDQLRQSVAGIQQWLSDNSQTIKLWGTAIINSFTALGRTLYNAVTMIAKIITAPIVGAVGLVRDAIDNIKGMMEGDFTFDTTNVMASWDTIKEGIAEDGTDMADAWLKASDAVDGALGGTKNEAKSLGDTIKRDLTPVAKDSAKEMASAAKKVDDFKDKISDVKKEIKDLTKEYKENKKALKEAFEIDIKELTSGLATDIASALVTAQDKITELMGEMTAEQAEIQAKMNEDVAGKNQELADLQIKMAKAVAEEKKSLNEDLAKSDKELADLRIRLARAVLIDDKVRIQEQIADAEFERAEIIKKSEETTEEKKAQIQEKIADAEKEKQDMIAKAEAETEAKKTELQKQIDSINEFLNKHKADLIAYQAEIKAVRDANALDEIEVLRATYLAERKETEAKYKQDLKDLKNSYEDKQDELKDHIKEIKKELKEFLSSKEAKSYMNNFGDISINASKKERGGYVRGRQFGGHPSMDELTLVGEAGPELVKLPVGSKVIPNNELGGGGTTSFYFNFAGAVISDKNDLIKEIISAINRKSELRQLGSSV